MRFSPRLGLQLRGNLFDVLLVSFVTVLPGCAASTSKGPVSAQQDYLRSTLVYDVSDLVGVMMAQRGQTRSSFSPGGTTQPSTPSRYDFTLDVLNSVRGSLGAEDKSRDNDFKARMSQLIITDSIDGHRRVAQIIHDLRDACGPQITVELRFLFVEDAALQKALPKFTPVASRPVVGGLLDLDFQRVGVDDVPLDDLLKKTKATIVVAEHVTILSGERRWTGQTFNSRQYVADYTTSLGEDGVSRYKAVSGTVASDEFSQVFAVERPDREKITVHMESQIQIVLGIKKTPFPTNDGSKLLLEVPEIAKYFMGWTTLTMCAGEEIFLVDRAGSSGVPALRIALAVKTTTSHSDEQPGRNIRTVKLNGYD